VATNVARDMIYFLVFTLSLVSTGGAIIATPGSCQPGSRKRLPSNLWEPHLSAIGLAAAEATPLHFVVLMTQLIWRTSCGPAPRLSRKRAVRR
jgi:hypothetical protein